jgi:hypothetical protein
MCSPDRGLQPVFQSRHRERIAEEALDLSISRTPAEKLPEMTPALIAQTRVTQVTAVVHIRESKSAQRYNPEEEHRHLRRRENLMPSYASSANRIHNRSDIAEIFLRKPSTTIGTVWIM